jgi:basic membrane protein A
LTAAGLAACGGTPASACAHLYRVALVTSTADPTVQEASAEAVQGLTQARAKASLCIGATAIGSSVQAIAGQGYDLVIAVGPGFTPAAQEVARARPKTRLAVLDAALTAPPANLVGVSFRDDQAAFLVGAAAGLASHTHVVTGIYGVSGDETARRLRIGFENGVQHIAPQTLVRGIVQPPGAAFGTAQWSSQIALDQVGVGADVFFASPGTPSEGTLRAIAALGHTPDGGPVSCIGVEVDEFYSFPTARPCLLTSAEKRFGVAVQAAIAAFVKGRWPITGLSMDVRSGGVGDAPFHSQADPLNAAQRAALEATRKSLANGSLATGVG